MTEGVDPVDGFGGREQRVDTFGSDEFGFYAVRPLKVPGGEYD